MNHLLIFDQSFSLTTLIKTQLNSLYDLSNIQFSIDLSKNKDNITYKTCLCLSLTQIQTQPPLYLAQNIANIFNQSYSKQDIFVKVSDDIWLEFIIGDRLINQWLNEVNKIEFLELKTSIKNKKNQVNFINYYIHARCCSILKSAHEDNIIKINNLKFTINQWCIEKPSMINYQVLSLSAASYEQKLIRELILITEKMANNKLNYQTSLINLGKAILDVECYCRIWGEIKIKNLKISQARLGLIAIGLYYYQNLFYIQFQQDLPLEI
ncbi:hypothetical protein [Geminocystis sp. GBBB08]|uniref:hypothetical protein n=1 Tax=Geminocystis sp. GBBB08 TaxID=2604140 RepID=UPI0027E3A1F5|nr:hypothetical protein [Geminocystis sp. GBBB08]MBL1208642.1 hypothetical protein [Geminocystis sp. GBBB08]